MSFVPNGLHCYYGGGKRRNFEGGEKPDGKQNKGMAEKK